MDEDDVPELQPDVDGSGGWPAPPPPPPKPRTAVGSYDDDEAYAQFMLDRIRSTIVCLLNLEGHEIGMMSFEDAVKHAKCKGLTVTPIRLDATSPTVQLSLGSRSKPIPEPMEYGPSFIGLASELYRLWKLADRAVRENEYEAAVEAMNLAELIDSSWQPALWKRGFAHWQLKSYERAVADYDKALELEFDFECLLERSRLLLEINQFDRAIADASKIVAAGAWWQKSKPLPDVVAAAHHVLGSANYQLGRFGLSIKHATKALRLKARANSYYIRGSSLILLRKYKQAQKDFDQAIALNDAFGAAYSARGFTAYRLGDLSQALADQNIGIDHDPSAYAHSVRAFTYCELKDFSKALEDANRAIELDAEGRLARPYFVRGVCLLRGKEFDGAKESFDRAISMCADYLEAFTYRGFAHIALERTDQALEDFRSATEGLKYMSVHDLLGLSLAYSMAGEEGLSKKYSAKMRKDYDYEKSVSDLEALRECVGKP
jgi:tetratricopeptide (TPR) repeat protein